MKPHLCLISCLVVTCSLLGGVADAGTTERVSVSSAGVQGSVDSYGEVSLSADGRYVAFGLPAPNLVAGDTNDAHDVFVHDRVTRSTERVSVSSAGEQDNAGSTLGVSLSADGRYVGFTSLASNLVPGDTNGVLDVFVHDRVTGITERVSVSSAGEQGNEAAYWAGIGVCLSVDGRYVGFTSLASNLVPGDTNFGHDVFVHDRVTGNTERVSVSSAGEQADSEAYSSTGVFLSADGRYVAFGSYASNLVPDDTNGFYDVFVHDRVTGSTERVSVSSAGEQGNQEAYWGSSGSLSADGRYVAFGSKASNLVTGDTNGGVDVFVHDRVTGITERVSVSSAGEQGNVVSYASSDVFLSADGSHVGFTSSASNLVAEDTNGVRDVFVHDRVTGATERVSVSNVGEQGNADANWNGGISLSADGRYVGFCSAASNLVSGDTNGATDAFVRARVGFWDVPGDHWAYDEILACAEAGIVQGYPDGTYQPGSVVARDQMAVYIARALAGGDAAVRVPTGVVQPSFPDVPADHWAYRHVEFCRGRGIVAGYWDGYHPAEVVSRAQMAVYVARSVADPTGEEGLAGYTPPAAATFADVAPDYWAYRHIEYCKGQGIVSGYWDGYHPEESVARDQMAVYVARAFGLAA